MEVDFPIFIVPLRIQKQILGVQQSLDLASVIVLSVRDSLDQELSIGADKVTEGQGTYKSVVIGNVLFSDPFGHLILPVILDIAL